MLFSYSNSQPRGSTKEHHVEVGWLVLALLGLALAGLALIEFRWVVFRLVCLGLG